MPRSRVTLRGAIAASVRRLASRLLSSVASAPAAGPTLTWVSDNATYDPTFSISPSPAVGDSYDIWIDDNSDFSSLYGSDTHVVTTGEGGDGQLAFVVPALGYATTYYVKVRKNGGPWSNVVSKLMAAAPVVASTFDPANKSNYAVLSNGNLTNNGTNTTGQACIAKSTTSHNSGKRAYQVTINNKGAVNGAIGFLKDIVTVTGNTVINPGNGNTNGVSVETNAHRNIAYNGLGYDLGFDCVTSGFVSVPPATAVNTVLTLLIDIDAGKFYVSMDGTFYANQNPATNKGWAVAGLAGATLFAAAGMGDGAGQITANFDTLTYPVSGFLPWGS